MFVDIEGGYNLREVKSKEIRYLYHFRGYVISIHGVNFWNSLDVELKQSTKKSVQQDIQIICISLRGI